MNKQEIREKAASFLDEIREGVAEILKDPNMGFDFSDFVSEFDEVNQCGTVCCMEGWIPKIRPDLAKYEWSDSVFIPVRMLNGNRFLPERVGIPINNELWEYLILSGHGNDLSGDSSFEEVSQHWKEVAKEIRKGDWDDNLLFSL